MTITELQRDELLEAARPLLRWLNANCHLHCTLIVDSGGVSLVEGVARVVCDDYIDVEAREREAGR